MIIRKPDPEDGYAVTELIGDCHPLDENSAYCNLLQCSHFRDTCALTEDDGEAIGFVSGYIVPNEPDTLFIWQVAVHERGRGQNLGKRMIMDIVMREECKDVQFIHTSITKSNKPSQKVFASIAKSLDTDVENEVLFHHEEHFYGEQPTEILYRIGPFDDVDWEES